MSISDAIGDILTTADGNLKLPSMQSWIAGILTVVVSFLWLQGLDVPEGLLNVYLIVIGFFFGDRIATQREQRASLPDPVSE